MGEALVERRRAVDVLVVVREQQPAVAARRCSGSTSNSIMSTPAASAASNDAGVLPGTIRSAPLWPIAPQRWHPGHQYVVRLSSPWPRARMRVAPQRGQGCAGVAVDDLEARPACRRAADSCMRGRVARTIASASSSATSPARRHGSTPAAKQPSAFHRLPIPAIDALVDQRVADRPRRVVLAQPAQERRPRRARARGCPARGRAIRWSKRARGCGHQLEHRPVDLGDLLVAAADHEPRAARAAPSRRRARATCRSCAGASGSPGRPRSAGRGACRGRRRAVTARPASRSGQRSRAEARVRRRDLVRHVPSSTGRIRFAAWWIVSPSGTPPRVTAVRRGGASSARARRGRSRSALARLAARGAGRGSRLATARGRRSPEYVRPSRRGPGRASSPAAAAAGRGAVRPAAERRPARVSRRARPPERPPRRRRIERASRRDRPIGSQPRAAASSSREHQRSRRVGVDRGSSAGARPWSRARTAQRWHRSRQRVRALGLGGDARAALPASHRSSAWSAASVALNRRAPSAARCATAVDRGVRRRASAIGHRRSRRGCRPRRGRVLRRPRSRAASASRCARIARARTAKRARRRVQLGRRRRACGAGAASTLVDARRRRALPSRASRVDASATSGRRSACRDSRSGERVVAGAAATASALGAGRPSVARSRSRSARTPRQRRLGALARARSAARGCAPRSTARHGGHQSRAPRRPGRATRTPDWRRGAARGRRRQACDHVREDARRRRGSFRERRVYVVSVSLRGPARKPSSIRRSS